MPVAIPSGVDVSIKAEQISVKGSGGTLSLAQSALVKVAQDAGKLTFLPADASREANAMSGTMRQLVNNMVIGVSKGFEKKTHPDRCGLQSPSPRCQIEFGCGLFAPGEH